MHITFIKRNRFIKSNLEIYIIGTSRLLRTIMINQKVNSAVTALMVGSEVISDWSLLFYSINSYLYWRIIPKYSNLISRSCNKDWWLQYLSIHFYNHNSILIIFNNLSRFVLCTTPNQFVPFINRNHFK